MTDEERKRKQDEQIDEAFRQAVPGRILFEGKAGPAVCTGAGVDDEGRRYVKVVYPAQPAEES